MAKVRFRRWGPYVWWICPSRRCNFENKTDLVFVQGTFETKCQYCNTPVTIKMAGGQLTLESSVEEEEEAKPSAPTPSAATGKPGVAPSAQPIEPSKMSPTPPSALPSVAKPAPPSPAIPKSTTETSVEESPAQKPKPDAKPEDSKKKSGS